VTGGAGGFAICGGADTCGGAELAGEVETGFAGAGANGFVSCAGGVDGGRGGAVGWAGTVPCCLPMIAFSTSPGLEMWDKSILVLIPSGSARPARADFAALWLSPAPRKWARTLSASWSSTELECVFFSVTPTSSSTSRIALLLTSSSLAKSLIRILLIRLFVPPRYPAKPSYQPRVNC
jgi:hypothetical protein